jgi:phycocyanobilin lyase beta subunit
MHTAPAPKLIQAVEQANSSARLLDAVRELADARLEAAIPTLIAAMGYNNPGAAVAAVDGLVQIGEAAVLPLLEQLDDYNYGARAWAIRALAGIGDPQGLDTLLVAAKTDFSMSVRRAAARGLGHLRWHQLPLEQIQPAQVQALEVLLEVSQDHEWIVRYAAVVGLEAIAVAISTTKIHQLSQIQVQFNRLAEADESLAVRSRTWLAQNRLQAVLAASQSDAMSSETPTADWSLTLAQLYNRKAQERPLREGDPRKFRKVAVAITAPKVDDASFDS